MSSGEHLPYDQEESQQQEIYFHILQAKNIKKNKSQTCIPEFVKVTGANNKAMATVASAVNVELDSFSQK